MLAFASFQLLFFPNLFELVAVEKCLQNLVLYKFWCQIWDWLEERTRARLDLSTIQIKSPALNPHSPFPLEYEYLLVKGRGSLHGKNLKSSEISVQDPKFWIIGIFHSVERSIFSIFKFYFGLGLWEQQENLTELANILIDISHLVGSIWSGGSWF